MKNLNQLLQNFNKATIPRIIFTIYLFSFLLVPFYHSFDSNSGSWENILMIQDDFLILIVSPIFLIWILYLWLTKKWLNIILQILLFLSSIFYSFIAFLSASMPIQDFSPAIGYLLLLLCCPFVIIFLIFDKYNKKSQLTDDDILDSNFIEQ